MDILEKSDSIILRNVKDFDVTHIFECGQCFRWERQGPNSFLGVVRDKAFVVEQRENEVELYNINRIEYQDFYENYFDMKRGYGKIKDKLAEDKVLKEAVKFGWGIRILNQDMWETLISFIISANNRIPMIKRAVKNISERYGSEIEFRGKKYHAFPTPEELKDSTVEEFERCGAGFRAKYIRKTIDSVLQGNLDIERIKSLSTDEAREELRKLSGVGPKISDCVLLFSAQKYDAFPTDVWVKRVMEHFYSEGELKLNAIQGMAKEMFGELAGFAQQYLFYYARELKIGK